MGSLRVRLIDRNRYSKRYPLIRAPKRVTYLGNQDLAVEVGSILFESAESGTLTFEIPFIDTSYQVIVSARDNGDSGGADVNVWVENVLSTSVTVRSSSPFTGYVDIFAMKVG